MFVFLSFVARSWVALAKRAVRCVIVSDQRVIFGRMALSTLLHGVFCALAGSAFAQTSPSEAAAFAGPSKSNVVSRLVVYRAGQDGLPDQTVIRINGSYLANLQRSSYAVICLAPQQVVLQLQAAPDGRAPAEPVAIPVSVQLRAGENRYIKAIHTALHGPQLLDLPLDAARPDILTTQFAVRTRHRSSLALPCSTTPVVHGTVQLSEAGITHINAQ